MKLKALKSFAGKISMYAGEVREIKDKFVVDDLLRAGYAEIEAPEAKVVEKPTKAVEKSSEKPAKKSTRKKKK